MKKIIVGSDHAGFKLKEEIKQFLNKLDYKIKDEGAESEEAIDYPLIGHKTAKDVVKDKCLGILICGTGIGMSIAANKISGIRAAVCHDEFTAEAARMHNSANILCIGARVLDKDQALAIVKKFIETSPSKEERHIRRVKQIEEI